MLAVVKQQTLQDLLASGIEKAGKQSKPVLVSQLRRVETCNVLAFFACAEDTRFFWRDPEQKIYLSGSGAATRLSAERNGRFHNVDQKRRELLGEAVIDADPAVAGGGPVFFGGFRFDPHKSKDEAWSSFPDAQLLLPSFMLTASAGESYLTINCMVDQWTNPDEAGDHLNNEAEQVLTRARHHPCTHPIAKDIRYEERAPQRWRDAVAETAQEISRQRFEKVVLSRTLALITDDPFSPPQTLLRLSRQQPNSFLFAVQQGEACFLGASPERLARQDGRQLQSACLAGSIQRGADAEEDERLSRQLLADPKNLHEHELVVTMIREAMADSCEKIHVPESPQIYQMKDIQHLYTPVVGTTGANSSLLQVVGRLHPTPALGGSPQKASLEKIREVESHDRGWYGAPIGWVDHKGDGDFAVAIRSGLIQANRAVLWAGSGIVADSDPEAEYRETQLKFRPMTAALGGDV